VKTFDISVPASSANLGPGFDTIGLALDLRLRATVRPAERFSIEFLPGPHAPTHEGFRDEIVRGFAAVLPDQRPSVRIAVDNPIPLGKGLGSSAAAAVLGARLAAELAPEPYDEAALVRVVTDLEGHPDNALPALLGGIIVAAQRGESAPSYLRFPAPPKMRAIVAIPDLELATAEARALLPHSYRKEDTVYNIQRAALLAAAFASGNYEHLRVAMADRIHQPYRAAFVPGLAECLALDLPGLYGIALSGAGPSVIGLVEGNGIAIAAAMREAFALHKIDCETWVLGITNVGVSVRETAVAATG
jgi:homoserine kinase